LPKMNFCFKIWKFRRGSITMCFAISLGPAQLTWIMLCLKMSVAFWATKTEHLWNEINLFAYSFFIFKKIPCYHCG
jgi:hypothetical protein